VSHPTQLERALNTEEGGDVTSGPGRWRARVNRAGAKQSGGVGWGFVGSPKSTRRSEGGKDARENEGAISEIAAALWFETQSHMAYGLWEGKGREKSDAEKVGSLGSKKRDLFYFLLLSLLA